MFFIPPNFCGSFSLSRPKKASEHHLLGYLAGCKGAESGCHRISHKRQLSQLVVTRAVALCCLFSHLGRVERLASQFPIVQVGGCCEDKDCARGAEASHYRTGIEIEFEAW